jgi:phosphoglycerol transferase MdoB-like AlkP superfamily enzyme
VNQKSGVGEHQFGRQAGLWRVGRYRVLIVLLVAYLAIGAGMRVLLWSLFASEEVPAAQLLQSLPLGLVNDLIESAYLFLPMTVALWLLPQHLFSGRRRTPLLMLLVGIVLFTMLYIAGLEYFFFEEFNARFNLVAVDYLIYPTEVIGNIRETYPVGLISAALALAAVTLTGALWPLLRNTARAAPSAHGFRRRGMIALVHVALVAALALTLPANALAPFKNRVANELASNGVASFFVAARTNQLDYKTYYRTGDDVALWRRLRPELERSGERFVRPMPPNLQRSFPANAQGLGQRNVVVIAEESFGAEFVGALGNERGLTPEFDALAARGLLFTHAYATGTRTVRGLEAISASFPPIPSESIVKRPGNESIVTWGEVMSGLGYHTSFLYGGYGTFDNMNAYFGGNGFALSDRRDIPDPKFANIWGVSDEDLFAHAIDYYDARAAEGKPFFSIVMSTSNHKPYTFPEGIPGIESSGGGRSAGVRYADYALGRFFAQARRHPWFADTVFVVVADHGARVYGAADIPLHSYEIPLLIYAPGLISPQQNEGLVSQIDIAPTVMGLLGLAYDAPFFGVDVLHENQQPRNLLFNHNHDVALLREGRLAVLGLNKSANVTRYIRKDRTRGKHGGEVFEAQPPDPDLLNLATAYFQLAYELFKHAPDA